MRKIKKLSLLLAALMTLSFSLTACDGLLFAFNGDDGFYSASESEINGSFSKESFDSPDEESCLEESSSEESSEQTSDSADNNTSEEEEVDENLLAMQQIVDLAYELGYGETLGSYELTGTVTRVENGSKLTVDIVVDGREDYPIQCYNLNSGSTTIKVGDIITVWGTIKNYKGSVEFDSPLLREHSGQDAPDGGNDPYVNVSKNQFYANYTPATSNSDAYYRSLHGLMSGEIQTPDQAPQIAKNQPKNGSQFIRNSQMLFDASGKEYTVVDAYGNEAFKVYRDGAYISIEEVAAYVYAFGTYPANYTPDKDSEPEDSIWGEYLRLNHSSFSGDTSRFPYEPVLPNISGCGGSLNYYEMDIGTTGTDCDPSYPIKIYNNGSTITRGAARIVYGKKDLNKNGVYEVNEHHVFYTYNHYNDFQEYLNYAGGWGEMFGNITGGGQISSKYNYNPTPYVEIALQPIANYGAVSLSAFRQNYYGV